MNTRIVCIADTHNFHDRVEVPRGDVLIHAGDLTMRGTIEEIQSALSWLRSQPHAHKVCIAGNHDWLFERDPIQAAALVPEGVTYLQHSSCTIRGLKFWGSPVQPWFFDWAFNRRRGAEIARHWDLIPADTDVLITHGPAYGHLDRVGNSRPVGCEMLLAQIQKNRPRLHVCGHIHDGYGQKTDGHTIMVNASICDEDYQPIHAPVVLDL